MSSSREQAMSRVRKWVETNSLIRASFTGKGLMFSTKGRLLFNEDETLLWLYAKDEDGEERAVLSLHLAMAIPCETLEPLLDAPEELRWQMDFVVAEGFRLPCGELDLFELAE